MNNTLQLGISTGVIVDEKLYFSCMELNGLFVYDLFSKNTSFLCLFEGERLHHKMHLGSYVYDKKIWFIPYQGEYISCFDTRTYTIEKYKVWDNVTEKVAFINVVRKNEILYLTPRDSDSFMEIDMKKSEINIIGKIEEENKGRFRSLVFMGEDNLGVVSSKGLIVRSIDIKNHYVKELEKIEEGYEKYLTTIQDGMRLWLIPFNSNELSFMELNNDNQRTSFPLEGDEHKQYYGGIATSEYLFMFPFTNDGTFLLVRKKDNRIQRKAIVADKEKNAVPIGVCTIKSDDSEVILGTENGYLLKFYGGFEREIQVLKVVISKDRLYRDIISLYKNSDVIWHSFNSNTIDEGSVIDLEVFLELLK